MKLGLSLIMLFALHMCSSGSSPQSYDLVGQWNVELAFKDQSHRSLRLLADKSGKGTLQLSESQSNWAEPTKPSNAKWVAESDKRITFMGPVQFPIGNVGQETGTIVFKGNFESDGIITGEFEFFPADQDPSDPKVTPSKTGKFKATRS